MVRNKLEKISKEEPYEVLAENFEQSSRKFPFHLHAFWKLNSFNVFWKLSQEILKPFAPSCSETSGLFGWIESVLGLVIAPLDIRTTQALGERRARES